MKKTLAALALLAVWFGAAATARAANESIGLSMEAEPITGSLYKEVHRPVSAGLTVTVSVPAGEPLITPLKLANVTFPGDMDFFPDSKRTPACPDSKLNDQSNLAAGVSGVVALCPDSVVGTGRAVVQMGGLNTAIGTVTDPQLVVFNAGRDESGRPKVLIYGYSKTVNTGLLMRGTLATNGELKISIGVLPFDTSVSSFTLGIPGVPLEVDESDLGGGKLTVKGLDPAYLRAKCSTGTWRATGSFVLGTRSHPSGTPISEDSLLNSNPFELGCNGLPGKARLKIAKVTGPKKVRAGRKATYRVTIANPGTATVKSVRLTGQGAAIGSLRVGALAPGKSRTVKLRVKATSRKGTRKLKLRLSGKQVPTVAVARKISVR